MLRCSKGTKYYKFFLSQASKNMREPLVLMFFICFSLTWGVRKFQSQDLIWKGNVAKLPTIHVIFANLTH